MVEDVPLEYARRWNYLAPVIDVLVAVARDVRSPVLEIKGKLHFEESLARFSHLIRIIVAIYRYAPTPGSAQSGNNLQ